MPHTTIVNKIIFLLLLLISLTLSQPQQCVQNILTTTIKRQMTSLTCNINYYYQQCSSTSSTSSTQTNQNKTNNDNSLLRLKSCTGYKCKLLVGDSCYYYGSQQYTEQQCVQSCCPTTSSSQTTTTNQQQSYYSTHLQQCLTYQSSTKSTTNVQQSSLSSPSNYILIIICSIIGFTLVLLIIAFICCRKKINTCLNIKHNSSSVGQIKQIDNNNNNKQKKSSSSSLVTVSDLQSPQCITTSTIMQQPKQQFCSICLSYSTDSITKCKHSFHLLCLAAWIGKNHHCPNCTSQDINPINVICDICKRAYLQIKLNSNPSLNKLQKVMEKIKCNHCKSWR